MRRNPELAEMFPSGGVGLADTAAFDVESTNTPGFQNVASSSSDAMQVDSTGGGALHESTAPVPASDMPVIENPFATMKFKADDHGFSVQPRKMTSTGVPIVGAAASGGVGHVDAAVSMHGDSCPRTFCCSAQSGTPFGEYLHVPLGSQSNHDEYQMYKSECKICSEKNILYLRGKIKAGRLVK